MNCKPGDLAVIVWAKSFQKNIGALVRVISASPNGPHPVYGHQWSCEALYPLQSSWGGIAAGEQGAIPDALLRPIRDNNGEDETLQWAGKPQEVTA